MGLVEEQPSEVVLAHRGEQTLPERASCRFPKAALARQMSPRPNQLAKSASSCFIGALRQHAR